MVMNMFLFMQYNLTKAKHMKTIFENGNVDTHQENVHHVWKSQWSVELLGVELCFLVFNNFYTINRDKAHVFQHQRKYASHQYK